MKNRKPFKKGATMVMVGAFLIIVLLGVAVYLAALNMQKQTVINDLRVETTILEGKCTALETENKALRRQLADSKLHEQLTERFLDS